jgi:hypothetical protein
MEVIVSKFQRNPTEEVRTTLKEFKGRHYIDIRIYFLSDSGQWKPTRKGISLSVEYLSELKEAINSLDKTIREKNITQ